MTDQGKEDISAAPLSQISLRQRKTVPLVAGDVTRKVFSLFQSSAGARKISLDHLVDALQEAGLRTTDPRLKNFYERKNCLESPEVNELELETVMGPDVQLIATALKQMLTIPDFPAFCSHVREIYEKCQANHEGHVATYIPALARVDPNYWGCSVCTVDGQRTSLGDSLVPFTIQSCSKPLTYALALTTLGREKVHNFVGQEPSGQPFNSVILDRHDKPHNPMINPGAITICALLCNFTYADIEVEEMTSNIMRFIQDMTGDEYLDYSDEVYNSEKATGYRNCAIMYLMKEKHWFPLIEVDEALSLYYKTCSILGNCETLSVIAATLANGGMCPLTNQMAVKPDVVRCVLSLMQSCGMYDYSGNFASLIGLPAKSGVSGAIMLVVPSVMGICMWSPNLDPNGNSCRGLQFCESLLNYYALHPYSYLGHADPQQEDLTKRPRRQREVNVMRVLFAASRGDTEALRSYFMRNLNMNVVDYDGRGALHVAAAEGHLDCVRFLVETCGNQLHLVDRHGFTPLREAEESLQFQVADYLKCVGAEK